MEQKQKRQRRDQRPRTPRPMELTARDVAILATVEDYRILRQDQLQALFFGSDSAAKRVLRRLYQHGFVERKFLPVLVGSSPTLYVLGKKGAELLRTELGLDEVMWSTPTTSLKAEFLEHTLAINDVRIAVTLAARQAGYTVSLWRTENDLKAHYDRVSIRYSSGKMQSVSLIPDSYFVLKTPYGFAHCFLELDRGTMTVARFKAKVQAYMGYKQSGAYTKRYNANSMWVLTVTTGKKRLDNLKAVTEAVGGRRSFAFALLSDLTPETIFTAPVWYFAGQREPASLIQPV